MTPRRKHFDHESPFWVTETPDYFITVCAEPRGRNQLCVPETATAILEAIDNYQERQRWYCHLAVLMPDHVHLLVSFPDIPNFSRTMGDWKAWLSRRHGIQWQENFFEHRIRNEKSDRYKSDYIMNNPIRAGLAKRIENWPYYWFPKQ